MTQPLSPTPAAHWLRFRTLMIRMALLTALAILITFGVLRWQTGPLPLHFVIAVSLGMFAMVMLTVALMGLVFISATGGHDEAPHVIGDDDAS